MSRTLHVIGFRPPDEKWKRMKAVWDACLKVEEIDVPEEVREFFEYKNPNDAGVEVPLDRCVSGWDDEDAQGLDVDLKKLPKDVTVIRCLIC